jgi:two-component system chemotaxis response regulator CheB
MTGGNARLANMSRASSKVAAGIPHQRVFAGARKLVPKVQGKDVKRLAQLARPRASKVSALPATANFPVIAMAASVGGLHALSVILGGLPAKFPAAIAIVMHLSPDHPSILAEILNRRTHLPVRQAQTGDVLCPSCVFVAPPNHHLFVNPDGRLKLSSSSAVKVHFARPSAEPLFASVAELYGPNAIAVVLTGGDGDGSFGVQIIKDKGGMVIAQDRPTSKDFSMPETSIKTGDVDFILPLDGIAAKLIELVRTGRETRPAPGPAKFVSRHPAAGAKIPQIKHR